MCWVVNGLGVCESKYLIENSQDKEATASTFNLSKQELVSCYWDKYPPPEQISDAPSKYDQYGFRVGSIKRALKYIEEHGVSMEVDWPWTRERGVCKEKPNPKKVFRVKGFESSPTHDPWKEKKVLEILRKHPLAAAIEITHTLRNLPKGEMYCGPKEEDQNFDISLHAVLVTGFGTDSITKMDYYIIRNSWGEEWGDEGYARVKRFLVAHFCYPKEVELVIT
ncbi:hypothetical protein LguiA_002698 [Lonicera macranthoides]